MRRFVPPVLLALLVIASAPAIGELRDWIFETFPGAGVKALGLSFAALLGLALLLAVARIREHRGVRYLGLAAVLVLLWLQASGFGTDDPRVDAAEKVHVLEYGLLAYLLYLTFRPRGDLSPLPLTLLWVTIAGTLEETVQWLAPQRIGEIRDVALNVVAGLCGLLFALSLHPPIGARLGIDPRSRRLILRTTAGALLAAGLFFLVAHLGHRVEDPEIGWFRSRFTAEELGDLTRRRTLEWAAEPPTGLEVWGFEDRYLSEAGSHAQHRNERLAAGDAYAAWQANRILETYYDPFLDLESFRGSGRHRWPAELHAATEAALPDPLPRRYQSPVFRGRLYLRPSKGQLLAFLLPAVLALWWLGGRFERLRAGRIDS